MLGSGFPLASCWLRAGHYLGYIRLTAGNVLASGRLELA